MGLFLQVAIMPGYKEAEAREVIQIGRAHV